MTRPGARAGALRWLTVQTTARWILGGWASVLVFVLLNPSADVPADATAWVAGVLERLGWQSASADGRRLEIVENVLLFVPLSALGLLSWPRSRWTDWVTIGFLASMAVETTQGVLLPGRSAEMVDVVANTTGATLGAVAAGVLLAALRRPPPEVQARA